MVYAKAPFSGPEAVLAYLSRYTHRVPATEKIVSIFEEHTDIIVKGSRDIQYGHKINLSTGKIGLVLDVVIEEGNPADTDQCTPMLERHPGQIDSKSRLNYCAGI